MKKFPINLVNLKYFFDAVQEGSISLSAKMNFVSQSAVSQGIVKLERYLGHDLLDHQSHRFKTTPKGQQLFESAKTIFLALERAEEAFALEGTIQIEVGFIYSYAIAYLPHIIEAVNRSCPHIKLKCHFGLPHQLVDWLKKGMIDFAILLDNLDFSAFDSELIDQGHYRLYVSSQKKLGKDPAYILDSEERIETNLLKKAYKKHYGKSLPVFMEIRSWEVVASLIQEGLGVGFLPEYVAKARKGAIKLYSNQFFELTYNIHAVYAKDHPRKDFLREMFDLLKCMKS